MSADEGPALQTQSASRRLFIAKNVSGLVRQDHAKRESPTTAWLQGALFPERERKGGRAIKKQQDRARAARTADTHLIGRARACGVCRACAVPLRAAGRKKARSRGRPSSGNRRVLRSRAPRKDIVTRLESFFSSSPRFALSCSRVFLPG